MGKYIDLTKNESDEVRIKRILRMKLEFNGLFKRYIELDRLIENCQSLTEKNELFNKHKKEWQHLRDTLGDMYCRIGPDGYVWPLGYVTNTNFTNSTKLKD